ncbi:MAG: tetratricopeptide repeat protein, partial [candidate division WOR-3 bacterium]
MPEPSERERAVLLSFAERVDRSDPGALNNLGVLYYRKGMYSEAMEQFKEALRVDPKFDLARENIRYLFVETGLEDPDVKRWREEVKRDPENFEALLRLGVSYQSMGRSREASEILGAVVERSPDHAMARFHLAAALKAQGLYQQALEHYIYIRDAFSKSAVFHTDLGEVYYNLGRTDEAIAELSTAIKIDADYWRSHFLLSFAYGDNGRLQEALEESRIASRLNPSFQNSEANLALSNYGKQPAADAALSCTGKEVASLESTSFTLGMAYRERGFLKEALKEF